MSGIVINPYVFAAAAPVDPYAANLMLYLNPSNSTSYPGSGTSWYDLSGRSNTFTLTGTPTYTSSYSGAFYFNGSTQYASRTSGFTDFNTSTFSIMAWINFDVANTYKQIFSRHASNTTQGHWQFRVSNDNTLAFILFNSSNTVIYNQTTVGYTLSPNTWYHVACSAGNNTGSMYINGVERRNVTYTGTVRSSSTNAVYVAERESRMLSERYRGLISNVYFYNTVLPQTYISDNYNSTKAKFGL